MKHLLPGILFIACLIYSSTLIAQQKSNSCWKYSGMVQGGMVAGSTTITYAAQTVQGIQKNNWFAGIGAGYDNYGMPGIPLVLHGQKAFTQLRAKPFVYAQSGVQLPVKTGDWDQKGWDGKELYDLHTGFVGELGVGYLVGLGKSKKTALIFSTGYSYKYNTATYSQLYWPPYLSSLPPEGYDTYTTEKHAFHYRRIAVKVGFKF